MIVLESVRSGHGNEYGQNRKEMGMGLAAWGRRALELVLEKVGSGNENGQNGT